MCRRGIRCEATNAARIGKHPNATGRAQHAGARQQARRGKQILDRIGADDAILAADTVENPIVANQRACMRTGGARGDFACPKLADHDRLRRIQRAARDLGEAGWVADSLQEQRNGADPWLLKEMLGEIRGVEIGLVAGADEMADPDALLPAEAVQVMPDLTAL